MSEIMQTLVDITHLFRSCRCVPYLVAYACHEPWSSTVLERCGPLPRQVSKAEKSPRHSRLFSVHHASISAPVFVVHVLQPGKLGSGLHIAIET